MTAVRYLVADLDASLPFCSRRQVRRPTPSRAPAGRWAAIADPEGNLIELFEQR